MAEIHGNVGDIRHTIAPYASKTTISFADSDPDEIRDSADGLADAGFLPGDLVTVSGSASNDGNFTIGTATVGAGTIILTGTATLTTEAAGATVTLSVALPGQQLAGFYNWTLTSMADLHDTTTFADENRRKYTAGLLGWSATAEKFWLAQSSLANDNQDAWVGGSKLIRFFTRYDATPATTNAYYYQGTVYVTGIDTNAAVDDIVTQTITMTGDGTLTGPTTRSSAWPTGGS